MTSGPSKQRQPAAAPERLGAPSGRGRPRDRHRRAAVINATRELLVTRGPEDLTLAGIARQAGVSRPYVYDRWGTKFALIEEAIFTLPTEYPVIDDDMPFIDALTALISGMVRIQTDSAYLAALPAIATMLHNRGELLEQLESRYTAPIRTVYVALIERGKAEGVVRPEVDGSALFDTVRGAVLVHALVNPALAQPQLVEHLASLVLGGIARET